MILERPLEVAQHMEDVEVKENSSVTLTCGFSPSPRLVRWFKGRTALKTSNKYSMKREGKHAELTIHGLIGMDAGQYRCMAGGAQSTAHVRVEGRSCDSQTSLVWLTGRILRCSKLTFFFLLR